MDGLLVLLALVVLAIPISIIVLLVGQSRLSGRVRVLELALMQAEAAQKAAVAQPPAAGASVQDADPARPPTAGALVPVPPASPAAAMVAEGVPDFTITPPPEAEEQAPRLAADGMSPPTAPPEALAAAPPAPSGPVVFTPDLGARLMKFLRENWVYVVSAASLALAGVFLVQYGIEQGLIPPGLRVLTALAFGGGLVWTGQYLRRRFGDAPDSSVAFLPATFSGAGVVVLYAAVISARTLYGLIGPELAMLGYVATAALSIGLGWINGPLLVAIGLIGATAAPFLVAGDAEPGPWLYLYYGIVTAAGLAVDAWRRWAWVSVLALALGFAGGWLMHQAGAGAEGWLVFLVILPLLATAIPDRSLVPGHEGPSLGLALRKAGLPSFPVRLAGGTLALATLALMAELPGPDWVSWLVLWALLALALIYFLWAPRAEGLADLALIPAGFFLLALIAVAFEAMPLVTTYWQAAAEFRPPEMPAPMTATWIMAMATAITLAAAWRSLRGSPLALVHGVAAVLTAPVAAAILELFWQPSQVVGPFIWALHALALAGLMVALASRYAVLDGTDHRRMAHAALSALSLIALALFSLTNATPLTLALAVLIVAAAWLDRRFRLPEMGIFIQIGAAVQSYRLLVDPGLDWAMRAPVWQVILAFVGVIGAEVVALRLLREQDRVKTCGVLESAALALTAMLANVLLTRALVPEAGMGLLSGLDYNYVATLNALPWLVLMLTQLYRARYPGILRVLRLSIAVVSAVLASIGLLISTVVSNPLFQSYPEGLGAKVIGPWVFDTLALSYAVPGLILLASLRWLILWRWQRLGLMASGVALVALYVGLEIRRVYQGDWLGGSGVTQYELYTYTVALMLVGAALLYQAIARRSSSLRKIAMAVIGITVAKVFLLDAAGLTGLTRVFSFLGLGLSLAGLAWLNRWAGQVTKDQTPPDQTPPDQTPPDPKQG